MKSKSVKKTKTSGSTASHGGILCGTDFSEAARGAAEVAAAIARRMDVPLILAHAVEIPAAAASDAKVRKWLTASQARDLRRAADLIRKTKVNVDARAGAGRPDEMLVDLARSESARMIVISALGCRRAGDWFLGSVAERTVERATAPILVVRDADPLHAWVRGERPLKVFVCFNFTVTSEIALRWVKDLMALGSCEVVMGYVSWPVEEHIRLGGAGPLPFDGNPPDVQNLLERDMKARARAVLGVPVRCRVEAHRGRTEDRLAEMAKQEGADLVVVGSHQYQGFERLWGSSISRGLLRQAAPSVAVVPLATGQTGGIKMAPAVRHILVPTDFSDLANAAIPYAYSMLRGGGIVHLLHVVPPLSTSAAGRLEPGGPGRSSRSPAQLQKISAKLRRLIPREAVNHMISTQVEVVESRPVGLAVSQAAERLGVDLICLGSHGRSGLSTALVGSVAQDVMTRSRRPLLVVRPQPR